MVCGTSPLHSSRLGAGALRRRWPARASGCKRSRPCPPRNEASGKPCPPWNEASSLIEGPLRAIRVLDEQAEQLREEYSILRDCLCSAGLLMPQELAVQKQRRLEAARFRSVCVQTPVLQLLALAAGLPAVRNLASTARATSAACKMALFPGGEMLASLKAQRGVANSAQGPGDSAAGETKQRSVFTLQFFAWPLKDGNPSEGASSHGCSVPSDSTGFVDSPRRLSKHQGAEGDPDAQKPIGAEESEGIGQITAFEDSAGTGSFTEAEMAMETQRTLDIQRAPAARLEIALQPQPFMASLGESLLGATLQNAGRLITTSSLQRGVSMSSQSTASLESGGRGSEAMQINIPAALTALVPAARRRPSYRGGGARFWKKLLGYTPAPEISAPKPCSMMEMLDMLQNLGRAAGVLTARQLSEVAKDFSTGLRSHIPAFIDDAPYIYVCGGSCGLAVDSAERFSPQTGQWETLPSMCIPRRACAAACLGGRFYVMGGVDVPRFNSSNESQQSSWTSDDKYRPECFDPLTNKWELLPPMIRPFTHAAAASIGGLLYVFGGLSFGSVLDQAQCFDPVCYHWDSLEPMPTPRFECSTTPTRRMLYILGGANSCGEPLSVAEVYSPDSGQWTHLPRMNQPRYGCAAASVKGKVHVIGGHGMWENLASVEQYDPEAEVWSILPPMSMRRNHCGAAAACGKIYVFGGHTNGQDIITIECFNPERVTWEVAGLMALPRTHCLTAMVQP